VVKVQGKDVGIVAMGPPPKQNCLILIQDDENNKLGEVWYNPGQGVLFDGELDASAVALFEQLKAYIDEYIMGN
jgi:hypothetical protein